MSRSTSSPRHPRLVWRVLCVSLLAGACVPTLGPEIAPGQAPGGSAPPPAAPGTVWISPSLPAVVRAKLQLPASFSAAPDKASAPLQLRVGGRWPLASWVYALVAPFPTIPDGASLQDLRQDWQGGNSGPFGGQPLLMSPDTYAVLSAFWQAPAPGATQVLPADQLVDYAWARRPAWAIIPFEADEPRWKVLELDGLSPIHKDFDPAAYALTVEIGLDGPDALAQALVQALRATVPFTNRDPSKLTTLVMTGTTALTRATAWTTEQKGIDYPARDIGDWLRGADLTHISNEVSFNPECPYPNRNQLDLFFCSSPRYLQLLEDVGTKVVELTGNHLNDYGTAADRYTLQLYREQGWVYYGGGENLAEARQPVVVMDHGNRIAFIGCNPVGPVYDWATEDLPGSAPCDLNYMTDQIRELRLQGILPIATFQYYEY